jgi:hypothetical protein
MGGPIVPTVSLVYGFWGQNIGNAFFNLGGAYQLRKIVGAENLFLIQDASAYWTLHRKRSGNFANWWNPVRRVSTDWLVLQGPVLTSYVGTIWDEILNSLAERGVDVGLIGAGFFRYDADEVAAAVAFLRRHPNIRFVACRDSDTFRRLSAADLGTVDLFDGIDSVFFSHYDLKPQPLVSEPFVALNCDLTPEPTLYDTGALGRFRFTEDGRELSFSPREATRRSQSARYVASAIAVLQRGKQPRRWGDLEIVRTDHRTNPHLAFRTYGAPNSVASDEPYTYATLYANATAVLSDRVHAVALGHNLGTATYFLGETPRASLLDRVARVDPATRRIEGTVDLESEREAQLRWLRSRILR